MVCIPGHDRLLTCAAEGDANARNRLLECNRSRLHGNSLLIRLDRRLAARMLDRSDVVQETLADAVERLDDYLRDRPLPFYPWLRQIACERLVDAHRQASASRRSVQRGNRRLSPMN